MLRVSCERGVDFAFLDRGGRELFGDEEVPAIVVLEGGGEEQVFGGLRCGGWVATAAAADEEQSGEED